MRFKEIKPIERPEDEKKFSLKNPEDRAIIISLAIVITIVIIIIVLLVLFGGFFN